MRKRMYLKQTKSGVYQYRRRYDSTTAKSLGQKEFKRSLKTRDPKEALRLSTEAETEYNRICYGQKNSTPPSLKNRTDTLSYVLEKWLGHTKCAPRTKLDWTTIVNRFISAYGDLPLSEITRKQIRDHRNALAFYPSERTNWENQLPFRQLVKKVKSRKTARKCLSSVTIKKEISALRSLFNYAINELDMTFTNPATNISLEATKRTRLPFTVEQLNKLFEDDVYATLNTVPHKYWLPLLALYTGARQEELAQCCSQDIKQHSKGFWYLDINKNHPHKKLKSESSVRKIPLHPVFESAGFIIYAKSQQAAGSFLLFPELKAGKDERLAKNYSQWFGRRLRKLGIIPEDTSLTRIDFHSFRHTLKDAIRDAGCSQEIHDRLTGHQQSGVGAKYGQGHALPLLYQEIEKIEFHGLNIPHLKGKAVKHRTRTTATPTNLGVAAVQNNSISMSLYEQGLLIGDAYEEVIAATFPDYLKQHGLRHLSKASSLAQLVNYKSQTEPKFKELMIESFKNKDKAVYGFKTPRHKDELPTAIPVHCFNSGILLLQESKLQLNGYDFEDVKMFDC